MTEKEKRQRPSTPFGVDPERLKRLEAVARDRRRTTGEAVTWRDVLREAIDKYLQ